MTITLALATFRLLIGQPKDDPALWYVTRGAAATAYVMLTLSVALGIAISVRAFEGIVRAWRIVDLHQVTSLLMLAFVGLHVATLLLDPFRPFSVVEIAWPLDESYRPVWTALGVLAIYLLAAVTVTSWLRRTIGNAVWRAVHWLSYAAFVLLTVHGIFTGTDTRTPWMLGVYFGACALVGWLAVARVLVGRKHAANSPHQVPATPRMKAQATTASTKGKEGQ